MNVEAYIASGILESYLLGELTLAEKQEVEDAMRAHPQVKAEMLAIEATMAELCHAGAIEPSANVRDKLLRNISNVPQPQVFSEDRRTAAPIELNKPGRNYPWLLAASIALAMLSSVSAVFFYNKWQESEAELFSVNLANQRYADRLEQTEKASLQANYELNAITSSQFKPVYLSGKDIAPSATARIFWNKQSKEVYLNSQGLPKPPPNKQYQLWVIADQGPVSLGVIKPDEAGLVKMEATGKAQTFAITLEPMGGSNSPTLDQMYVAGNVQES